VAEVRGGEGAEKEVAPDVTHGPCAAGDLCEFPELPLKKKDRRLCLACKKEGFHNFCGDCTGTGEMTGGRYVHNHCLLCMNEGGRVAGGEAGGEAGGGELLGRGARKKRQKRGVGVGV
jgi:hypothetical protein